MSAWGKTATGDPGGYPLSKGLKVLNALALFWEATMFCIFSRLVLKGIDLSLLDIFAHVFQVKSQTMEECKPNSAPKIMESLRDSPGKGIP